MNLNILVIEDNKYKVPTVIKVMEKSYKYFKKYYDYEYNIYPKATDYDTIPAKISNLADAICRGRSDIDKLFEYIISLIEEYNINAIFLDFFLSEYDEKINPKWWADNTIGGKLVKQFAKSKYKDIPIVSFTKIDDENLKEAPIIYSSLLFYLPKEDNKNEFFIKNEAMFYKLINKAEEYNNKKNMYCDIAVICALQSELDAVLNLPINWDEEILRKNDKEAYRKGKLDDYTIIAISENKMGMAEAATIATRVVENFHPKYVVMTGIAAGIDKTNQNFLDLLMPDYVFNWQSGKYKVKKEKDDIEEKTIRIFEKDYRSEDTFFKHGNIIKTNKKEFVSEIIKKLDFNDYVIKRPNEITIHNDGMVSGSAVVADNKIVSEQIEERKINGIDMEAYGVVFACNNAPSKPKPIILKAISDFADEDKDDICQKAAMQISAQAFYVLFNKFITNQTSNE